MLKLTRKVQQAVVIHPRGKPDESLTMRVVDIVPNAVCIGYAGDGYEIHRAEKYSKWREESHDQLNNK